MLLSRDDFISEFEPGNRSTLLNAPNCHMPMLTHTPKFRPGPSKTLASNDRKTLLIYRY